MKGIAVGGGVDERGVTSVSEEEVEALLLLLLLVKK